METHLPEDVGLSSERLARLSALMEQFVKDNQMPGIMTLVQRKGKVRQHIKTVLFFAGQPLDGTTVPANVCGPSPEQQH